MMLHQKCYVTLLACIVAPFVTLVAIIVGIWNKGGLLEDYLAYIWGKEK